MGLKNAVGLHDLSQNIMLLPNYFNNAPIMFKRYRLDLKNSHLRFVPKCDLDHTPSWLLQVTLTIHQAGCYK